jgi:segregation and condensation protein B
MSDSGDGAPAPDEEGRLDQLAGEGAAADARPAEAEPEAQPAPLPEIEVHSHGPFELDEGFTPDKESEGDDDEDGKKPKRRGGIDLSKVSAVAEVDRLAEINIKSTVEAILFAADEPVTPQQIAKAIGGVKAATAKKTILALKEEYEGRDAGFEIVEEAGGWTMLTREDFAAYVRRLRKAAEARKLSGAALETLAVVAYKQPVQRAEIEDVRGVACGPMLRTLMEKDLVRTVGRAEALGRPLLYGTTKQFLKVFGLGSLKDLPKAGEVGAG